MVDGNMYLSIKKLPPKARIIPTHPPNKQMNKASNKNWRMILPCVAPMALRTPISRVRSFTETNMIFIIPIPPTTRERTVINTPVPPMAIFMV